jgi:hypothetical protein
VQSSVVNYGNYATLRNNCISDYIGAIDNQYREYEKDLIKSTSAAAAVADTAGTALSAGAAAIGGTTAQILSGISASLGTLRGSLSADILYSNSIIAIIAQMEADRKEQLTVILQREQQSGGSQTSTSAPQSGSQQSGSPQSDQQLGSKQSSGTNSPTTNNDTNNLSTKPTNISGSIHKDIKVQYSATSSRPARVEHIVSTRTITPPPAAKSTIPNQSQAQKGLPDYTMHKAAVDLAGYFAAGTFAHALVSLQQAAAAKAADCKAQVNSLKTTGAKTGSTGATDPDLTDMSSGSGQSQTGQSSGC